MNTKGNFLLMNREEFRPWLQNQKVTRAINKLQVHHTASPNYSTRKIVNGTGQQDKFVCLEGMRNYHVNTNGWGATAQHITTFEDGMIAISLDRSLNDTPIGVSGANTGSVCIENIGCFDKGSDLITEEQRKTIIHLYACLSDKFNVPIDTDHIIYHCWYSSAGIRLTDYMPGKSVKSCPGTNFWGDGNTISAANKGFLPAIKAELYRIKVQTKEGDVGELKKDDADKIVKVLQAAWQLDMRNAIDMPLDRKEISRLADEVRKAGGLIK